MLKCLFFIQNLKNSTFILTFVVLYFTIIIKGVHLYDALLVKVFGLSEQGVEEALLIGVGAWSDVVVLSEFLHQFFVFLAQVFGDIDAHIDE